MKVRSFLKFTILAGAGLCFALVAVFAVLLLFFQTDTGRAYLASELSRFLSSAPDTVVTVERVEGFFPFRLDLGRAAISDGQGPWLAVRDMHIEWSPLALLFGRISIGKVSASTVMLDRIPGSSAAEETGPRDPFSTLSGFPPVEVGRLSIGEFAVGKLVTGREAAFQVEGSLSPKERGHGVEASLAIEGKNETAGTRLHLELASTANPVSVMLTTEFHEADGGWVASALGLEEAGSMDFSLSGDGPVSAWRGTFRGSIPKFGSIQSSVGVRSSEEGVQLAAEGACRVPESFPSAEIASLIGKENRFELTANIGPSGMLSVRKADFESECIRLGAAGTFDLAGRKMDGKWTLRSDSLDVLTGRFGKPAAGLLAMEGSFGGTFEKPEGTASARLLKFRLDRFSAEELKLDARIRALESPLNPAEKAIGIEGTGSVDGLSLRGAFELSGKSHLAVPVLQVESDRLSLRMQADVDFSMKTGKVDWRLAVPRLDRIGPAFGLPVAGSLDAEGTVEGPFHAPQSKSTLKVSGLEFHGRKIERLLGTVIAGDFFTEPRGAVQVDLRHGGQSLLASSGFNLKGKRLGLSSISVKAPGTSVAGNLAVDLDTRAMDGSLKGDFADLAALGRLAGEPLEGSASVDLRLDSGKGGQAVKLVLHGSRISTRYGAVKAASLSADLGGILDVPSGNVQIRVDDFERPGISLKSLRFKASGGRREMDFDGTAKGRASRRFTIQTRGAAVLSREAVRVRLDLFKGDFGKNSFTLLKPARFERTSEAFAVEDLAVGVGSGQLSLSGRTAPRAVSINGVFEKIPLGLLSTFGGPSLSGLVAGRIAIEGRPLRPSGSCSLKVTDIFTTGSFPDEIRGTSLTCDGKYGSGRMDIAFELVGGRDRPVTGRLEIPMEISFAPWTLSVPSEGSIGGSIEVRTDLAILTAALPIEGHRFAGALAGSVELGGTVAKPVVNGRASVTDGAYENYTLGTVLKNVKAVVAGKGDRIELEEFNATDGEKGAVSAGGWARMESRNSFPLEIQASMSSFRLIRRGDSTAVAKGKASLSGSSSRMTLSGDIEIETAEFDIRKQRSVAITSLKVIDVYGPGKSPPVRTAESDERENGSPSSSLGVDIQLVLPGRSFLRGEGLNSEWKGRFHLQGSVASPSLVGQLSVVRGTFQFLGKNFTLANGVIQFDGTTPPNPLLDVTAQVQAEDVKAKVILSGLVSSPDIRLESEPSLPGDEILARVLFKRSLNQINPTQAMKIAAALSGLAGKGSAFDFVERTRSFLGLDQLELRQPEEGKESVAVAVGKYLTDQIYVDLQKDVGSGGAEVAVEVEVSPHVTLGSKVGTNARKGLEVNWKLDY